MRHYLVILLLWLTIQSCQTIPKSHRSSILKFSSKTEIVADIPLKIMDELHAIRETRGLYYAASFENQQNRMHELNEILNERILNDAVTPKIVLSYKILDSYARALSKMASDSKISSALTSNKKLGSDLDTFILTYNKIENVPLLPENLGSGISELTSLGLKYHLGNRQRKLVKEFIYRSDTLVNRVCQNLCDFLSSENLNQLISTEENGTDESFLFYFTRNTPKSIEADTAYLNLKRKINLIRQLQKAGIREIKSTQKAHTALVSVFKRNSSFTDISEDIYLYKSDVTDLINSLGKVSSK